MANASGPARFPVYVSAVFSLLLAFFFLKVLPMAESQPVFLLTAPLVCLLFLGMVLKPRWVVALLLVSRVLLDPFLNTTRYEGGLGFGAVLNLLVVLITVFLLLKHRSVAVLKAPFLKSWVFFLGACLVAVFFSPVLMTGTKVFFNLLSYLCMAALPFLLDPEKNDKKFWIKVLLFSSVLPVALANLDMARGGVVFQDAGNRILGTFSHPNILAFYLVWVLMLLLYVLKSGVSRLSGMKKFVLFLYMIDIFVLLIATRTRNAWICAWLLFFLYGLFKEKKYIFFSLAVLVAGFFMPSVTSRFTDLVTSNSEADNSFAWRLQVWKDSLEGIGERWAFGHGLGSFRELSGNFLADNKKGADAHNIYVQMAFETGLLGLGAFLLIYWKLFREFLWRYRKSVGGLSSEYAIALIYVILYLVSGLGDNMLYYLTLNWYGWFFLGVVYKAGRFQRMVNVKAS